MLISGEGPFGGRRLLRPRMAMSLLEAIISSFILLSAFLVIFALMDSAFGYMSRSESQQLAANLAERQLEEMRIWAETPNGSSYNYQNPGLIATYDGVVSVPADYSDFSVATKVTATGIYSPCSSVEIPINSPPFFSSPFVIPRYISGDSNGKSAKVQATVSWSGGTKHVSVVSLFSEPPVSPVTAVTMTASSSGDVPPDKGINFSASATDANGNLIQGLLFNWWIVPIDGSGTLTQARDGSVANLTNRLYGPPFAAPDYLGTPAYSGGHCYMQATATYHGQKVTVTGPSITLLAP